MPSVRLLGTLAVLALVAACNGSPTPEPEALRLPDLELLETTEGVPYEVSLGATGGTPPLRHSLEKLPPGFTFYMNDGLLRGPAEAPGQYTFTVQVRDTEGAVATRTYRLLVHSAPTVSTTLLASATVGAPYEAQLEVNGGKGPMRWAMVGGTLPAGLSLNEDGRLTGIPEASGTYAPAVRAQDVHGAQASRTLSLSVHPAGQQGFNVGNWNLAWFGDPTRSPSDDALQLDNVRRVMLSAGADFWGLQELVDATEFNALKQSLGYDGFMANDDSRVPNGSYFYSDDEQKVGILFRPDVVSVRAAQVILTSNDYYFAGRPPLRVDLRITQNGVSVDLVAIVLHMKAQTESGTSSYYRRQNAALVLESYLETQLPNTPFIVLGDWNDDVDQSIVASNGAFLPTPFQNFLDDPAHYTFVTQPLSLAGQRSTVSYADFIDHQLISDELRTNHVSSSTRVLRPDLDIPIPSYKSTTTDHYPVLSRFAFGATP
ncbi:putative Ig domain-containing protein [Archangium violaceum]|uniref:putative Ig domain-containing protein n=1 Tax=Archangium violaceum TaxID=83451 RepID=UPI00193C7511|nr:putative Ig domain-containing protein [Archangium violaceum]QRK09945.1 putative Ig domain-containing protein [Archangium violaceum]